MTSSSRFSLSAACWQALYRRQIAPSGSSYEENQKPYASPVALAAWSNATQGLPHLDTPCGDPCQIRKVERKWLKADPLIETYSIRRGTDVEGVHRQGKGAGFNEPHHETTKAPSLVVRPDGHQPCDPATRWSLIKAHRADGVSPIVLQQQRMVCRGMFVRMIGIVAGNPSGVEQDSAADVVVSLPVVLIHDIDEREPALRKPVPCLVQQHGELYAFRKLVTPSAYLCP
jgi:hypothetical protein